MTTAAPRQENGRPTNSSNATRPLRQALASKWVSLIRDGEELATRRQRFGYLVSIAMSAQRKGWTESQYRNTIAAPCDKQPNRLWDELHRDERGRPDRAYKSLSRAWQVATLNLADCGGMRSLEDLAADADELGMEWLDALDDRDLMPTLSNNERAALAHIAYETMARRSLRVAVPVRELAKHLGKTGEGTSPRYASKVLHSLMAKGYLDRWHQGTHGPNGSTGDASIYALTQAPKRWEPVGSHRHGVSLCEPIPEPAPEQQEPCACPVCLPLENTKADRLPQHSCPNQQHHPQVALNGALPPPPTLAAITTGEGATAA